MAGMGLPPNNIACPWVGDKGCVCPLPKGKVPGVWCRFPAISKNLKAFLYGWLPLSNAYGISSVAIYPTHNGYRHFFRCNTNQYITAIGIYSFQYNPNITAFHPIHHKPNMMPTAVPPFGKTTWKNPTKTCRGKVMKEKLKSVKTTLHPSFFIIHFIIFHSFFSHRLGFAAWKVSFHRLKGYVSPPETWSFVQRNLTFRKFIFSRPSDYKLTFV